jgi:arabinofuranosyltransferase
LQGQPVWSRFMKLWQEPLTGVGSLLLPGAIFLVWNKAHKGSWPHLLGLFWAVLYLGLYAWRLPVSYQHGRYLIPMMAVYFIWGFAGLMNWVQTDAPGLFRRVISKTWVVSLGAVLILYWIMGARAYAGDVAFIESEMVTTAHWVAEHTPSNALIAAHDIGALGYFGQRRIIDMAGLISPEVIPFIRDEARLRAWLDQRQADYLMTFPGWYPRLVQAAQIVYRTNSIIAPGSGGENMAVYRWDGLRP